MALAAVAGQIGKLGPHGTHEHGSPLNAFTPASASASASASVMPTVGATDTYAGPKWTKNPVVWRVGSVLIALGVGAVVLTLVNVLMVPRPMKCVTPEDCRAVARLNTMLVGIKSALNFTVGIVLAFIVLGLAGVDARGLLVSAGVLGLVVGLGAQSLIKSFIAGFTLLTNDRLALGDYVALDVSGGSTTLLESIGATAGGAAATRTNSYTKGIVRGFTMTTTTLEDTQGARTFIPNGNIAMVTNFSQQPQRATVDVLVSNSVNPATLRPKLAGFLETLALDEKLRNQVLRPPAIKGIGAVNQHGYTVTVTALAAPAAHFAVERHLRERLLEFLSSEKALPNLRHMLLHTEPKPQEFAASQPI